MYHIGYLNANSLHDRKFAQAICLLEKSFDILFIAEHWYQNQELRLSHPLVYCSTSRAINSGKSPPRGRSHGGIYLLVKNTFVLLSCLLYPLLTRLLSHCLAFGLPLFIILHIPYRKISLKQVCIKSVLLIFCLVISTPHSLRISNLPPIDPVLQYHPILFSSKPGLSNPIWSISPIIINIQFHT